MSVNGPRNLAPRRARLLEYLLQGRGAYVPQTRWGAMSAVVVTLAILGCAPLAAFAAARIYDRLAGLGEPGVLLPGEVERQLIVHDAVYLVVLNATMIALTLLAASSFSSRAKNVLALHSPPAGDWAYATAISASIAAIAAWFGIMLTWKPEAVIEDLRPYLEMMARDGAWLLPPIFCLAAPVAEELLFRGFLFSALSKSRLGFVGAALLTTAAWTSLHVGRSPYAHAQLFASGLFLTWLLVWTGSLRVPILCHMLFNSGVTLLVAFRASGMP